MKNAIFYFVIFAVCHISNPLHSQDGRIDTLFSVDNQYEFVFKNNIDSNDILSLDLIQVSKNDSIVFLGDTIIQIQHKFYNNFFLEFEQNKIYKYLFDQLNNHKYYVYTDSFTMPKGGRLELAYCLYGNVSYPEQAYQLKVEGLGFVQAFIDEKGCVTKAKPLTRIGYGIEQEIMKAVIKCGCVYKAGKRDGVSIKSIWNIPMRFEL